MKCANCARSILHGQDLYRVQQGVLGPRGFVPLDDTICCCDRCVKEYYSDPGEVADREDSVEF